MVSEAIEWPVKLQPWDNGKTFSVIGLPPRYCPPLKLMVRPAKRYTSDLTSSPTLARPLVSLWGRHGLAALYHDWLYRHQPGITRKQADRAMLAFMELDGVRRWRRQLIYRTLRALGWRSWNKNKKRLSDGD